MKKIILSILILCSISLSSCLLVLLAGKKSADNINETFHASELKFEDAELQFIKNSKTVFFIREKDNLEEMQKMIQKVWKISDIEVVKYDSIPSYIIDTNKTYLIIDGYSKEVTSTSQSSNGSERQSVSDMVYSYLTLVKYSHVKNKNGNMVLKKFVYSRMNLNPDVKMTSTLFGNKNIFTAYATGNIKNWNPYNLFLYFKDAQKNISEKNLRPSIYKKVENSVGMAKLKKDTLFVPDYLEAKINNRKGDESDKYDLKKIFSGYKYIYKIVSVKELNRKVLNSKKEVFVFDFVLTGNNEKYLSIYSSIDGMIYHAYHPGGGNKFEKKFVDKL